MDTVTYLPASHRHKQKFEKEKKTETDVVRIEDQPQISKDRPIFGFPFSSGFKKKKGTAKRAKPREVAFLSLSLLFLLFFFDAAGTLREGVSGIDGKSGKATRCSECPR